MIKSIGFGRTLILMNLIRSKINFPPGRIKFKEAKNTKSVIGTILNLPPGWLSMPDIGRKKIKIYSQMVKFTRINIFRKR